jgi:Asp-tRNA(Asn)/Glu-tRNA(Gln) amidotransferase A subunit family amidase
LRRRSFLLGAAASAGVAATRFAMAASNNAKLIDLSATEAVARMSRGEFSVESYASELLARCESQRDLNAFISFDPQRVLADARARDAERWAGVKCGPLFGLPIPIKDSVNTADYPTTAGTPALRKFRPAADAPVVAALRAAGAIVLGKTNLHELSFGWTSNNLSFGAVHNPYDHTRIPGGSSGGTAAAVAARCAPLGVAEDTEGSIRVPAAFCGIAGFRPTTGRYSTAGCVPITHLFDQVGPHARHVADLGLFDSVIANDPTPIAPKDLKGVRLGVVRDYWYKDLDPEVADIAAAALQRLRDAGAVLVEEKMPDLGRLISLTTSPVQLHDTAPDLAKYLKTYGAGISLEQLVAQSSEDIRTIFRSDVIPGAPNAVTEAVYTAARDIHLPALKRLYQDFFARTRVAAIVFPATMVAPPAIGNDTTVKTSDGRELPFEVAVARNIGPGSTAGVPGLVLPAGLTRNGLPVALEFDGPSGTDRALLALGLNFERVLGSIQPP